LANENDFTNSSCIRCFNVTYAVPDQHRGREVKFEIVSGREDHPGAWLAPWVIISSVFRAGGVRMKWTVVNCGNRCALSSEALAHVGSDNREIGFGVMTSADTRLVRYHDDRMSCRARRAGEIEDAGLESEVLDAVYKMAIDVYNAVAIEEERGSHLRSHGVQKVVPWGELQPVRG
jgi:hypothetical protein